MTVPSAQIENTSVDLAALRQRTAFSERKALRGRAFAQAWLREGFWRKVMPPWLPVSVSDEVGVCREGGFILRLQRS